MLFVFCLIVLFPKLFQVVDLGLNLCFALLILLPQPFYDQILFADDLAVYKIDYSFILA